MLRRLNELIGYTISADEEIGSVDDFYFDENTWTVRYMVANTGSWFSGRKVLVSTAALGTPRWLDEVLSVNLTRKQVENGPSIDLAKPVSQQQETELSDYYGWPMYWLAAAGAASGGATYSADGTAGLAPVAAAPIGVAAAEKTVDSMSEPTKHRANHERTGEPVTRPLIRSVKEVTGYYISANDGDIGHVEDFFADDTGWGIHYMLVDTRNWLPGRKVLVAPNWISRVSWDESKVHVNMSREQIQNSPEYDPTVPLDRDYETRLFNHYGYPGYWV